MIEESGRVGSAETGAHASHEAPVGLRPAGFDPARTFVICWPWRLRGDEPDGLHPIGANCRYCRRDVAQPRSMESRRPVCIYCALDRGITDAVEIPPTDEEPFHLRFAETVR